MKAAIFRGIRNCIFFKRQKHEAGAAETAHGTRETGRERKWAKERGFYWSLFGSVKFGSTC